MTVAATQASPQPSPSRAGAPKAAPEPGQAKPQASADQVDRFASALARQKDGKGMKEKNRSFGSEADMPADGAAIPAPPSRGADHRSSKADQKPDDAAGSPASLVGEKAGHHAAGEAPSPGASAAAAQETAAQFAARLALPQGGLTQSHLQLDERLYAISNLVIESGAGEGLSISYETSADAHGGQSATEETLRQRLEARGLTIATVTRAGR